MWSRATSTREVRGATMPGSVVTVQLGQCGNQVRPRPSRSYRRKSCARRGHDNVLVSVYGKPLLALAMSLLGAHLHPPLCLKMRPLCPQSRLERSSSLLWPMKLTRRRRPSARRFMRRVRPPLLTSSPHQPFLNSPLFEGREDIHYM